MTINISEKAYQGILDVAESIKREEEKERRYIQDKVDAKFTPLEQSILWQCMNDKCSQILHDSLNPIVRRRMNTSIPAELYRGITLLEANKIYDLGIGDEFTLGRVTSFSSDLSTAKQFCGKFHYNSNILFKLLNCPWGYNYQEDIIQIVMGAPDCEFNTDSRIDKIDMLEGENEFMLPTEASFRIIDINDVDTYTVIELELVKW